MANIISGMILAIGIGISLYLCLASVDWSHGQTNETKNFLFKFLTYMAGCIMTASFGCLFALLFYNAS